MLPDHFDCLAAIGRGTGNGYFFGKPGIQHRDQRVDAMLLVVDNQAVNHVFGAVVK